MQESIIILAMLLQQFDIVTDPNENVVPAYEGTVTPKNFHVSFVPLS